MNRNFDFSFQDGAAAPVQRPAEYEPSRQYAHVDGTRIAMQVMATSIRARQTANSNRELVLNEAA